MNIGEFTIRKITTEEQERFLGVKDLKRLDCGISYQQISESFLGCKGYFSELDYGKYIACEYVIETENMQYISDNIKYLLFVLRIYKLGDVFAPIFFNSEHPGSVSTQPYFMNCTKHYIIDNSELSNVEQLLNNILKITTDKRFQLIFDRFNIAINNNTSRAGGFTDFISILESLLLSKGSSGELSYKFSLYGSYLLKKLGINTSYNELKTLYTERSKIVHGQSIENFGAQYDRLYELTIVLIKEYCNKNIEADNIEREIFQILNIN